MENKIMKCFADIYCSGGEGGNGAISFDKGKNKPYGGNGGRGGAIFLKGSEQIKDLSHIITKREYKANNGDNGQKRFRTGKNGDNLTIYVPFGTKAYINDTDFLIGEVSQEQRTCMIANGGRGGKGNGIIRNNIEERCIGEIGEKLHIYLVYSPYADLVIVGYSNSGKSSLFNCIVGSYVSTVAAFPMTTKRLVEGTIAFYPEGKSLYIIDTPPLSKRFSDLNYTYNAKIVLYCMNLFTDISKVALEKEISNLKYFLSTKTKCNKVIVVLNIKEKIENHIRTYIRKATSDHSLDFWILDIELLSQQRNVALKHLLADISAK
jgi:GTP-binding protein